MRILRFALILLTITAFSIAQTSAAPASNPDKAPVVAKEDSHLSPAEAEELFKSLDDIMKFASDDTGLPIHSAIKRELGTREEVVQYIQQKMEEDEDTKRFERTELVLKKFGMLPLDFQLKPFLLKLLREQVAGFYDSKTKTMHLLDWLPAEAQRPVMAHELTHALQDQTVDLDKWTGIRSDNYKKAADPINDEIENDEDSTARSAVVEGQGTAVMVDYILLPMGKSLETSPELANVMKDSMDKPDNDMSVLNGAPVLLRETLVFPYRDGLGFVQAMLKAGGKKKAYTDVLLDPPHDTHQILHPQDYLDHKPTPVMHMPDLSGVLGKSYEKYDVGSIGEFDLRILFKQFGDEGSAKDLAPKWDGGMYYAALKTAKKVDRSASAQTSPAELALLYVSHWSSPAAAQQFAAVYGKTVGKRYSASTQKPCGGIANCSTWNTGQGAVTIQLLDNAVIVIEGFDDKAAAALRKLVIDAAKPTKASEVHAENLSMRIAAPYFAAHNLLHR